MKYLTWIFINFLCMTLSKADDFKGSTDIYSDAFSNDSDEADSFSEVNKILESLDQVSLPLNNEDVVIIFGTRNSGKKFLINLLTDNTDSLLYNTQEKNWVTNRNLKLLQNSSLLNLLTVNACSTLYLDFPTFNNYENLLNDIQSKYYIWKILSHAKSVKFLISIDYFMENESINISEFVELINHINSLITNIEKYSNSFSLIVSVTTKTQNANHDIEHLKEKVFDNLLKAYTILFDTRKKGSSIINSLLTTTSIEEFNKIEILLVPTQDEIISGTFSFTDDVYYIVYNVIHLMKFVNMSQVDFNYEYILRDELKPIEQNNFLNLLEKKIEKRLNSHVSKIDARILKYFQNYEENVNDIYVLKTFFTSLSINVTQLQKSMIYSDEYSNQSTISKLREATSKISNFIKNFNIYDLEDNFVDMNHCYDYLEFLEIFKLSNAVKLSQLLDLKIVGKFVEETNNWYTFLDHFYLTLSDIEVQKSQIKKLFRIKELQDVCTMKTYSEKFEEGFVTLRELYKRELKKDCPTYDTMNETHNRVKIERFCDTYYRTVLYESEMKCSDNTLQITGEFIAFDQIPPNNYCVTGIKRLELFAFDTLYINTDLIRTGEELEIVAIAPKWIVCGERKIVLDGISGNAIHPPNAPHSYTPGFDGEDGQPGLPGGPAGNFLGIGAKLYGANDCTNDALNNETNNSLTISMNGGNGGKGQDGGNGAKGKDGLSYTFQFKESYSEVSSYGDIPKELKDCNFHNVPGNTLFCITIEGSKGNENGVGGSGGKGGLPGTAGNILLYLPTNLSNIPLIVYNKSGTHGEGGIGGLGGIGSMDGQTIYGIYRKWERPAAGRYKHKITYNLINVTKQEIVMLPQGKNGESNKNTNGMMNMKNPAVTEFPLSVNKYKKYLREKISTGINSVELMNFYTVLDEGHSSESNTKVTGFETTLGFVNELEGLEEQFFELHNKINFLPFYKSLLRRVENYSKAPYYKENSKEHKKVLDYLCAAIQIKKCIIKDESNNYLINDIKKHLSLISESVQEISAATNQVNRNKINKSFKNDIDNKIREANKIIKIIDSEVQKINKKMESEIKMLTNVTIFQEKRVEIKLENDVERKKSTEKRLVMRGVFEVLKGVSFLASFCGPWGTIIGGLLETGQNYVEPLVLKSMSEEETKDFILKNSLDVLSKARGHIQSITDKLWASHQEALKKNIENLKNKEKELPDLKETREKLEKIKTNDLLSDKSIIDQTDLVISEEEQNLNNAIKLLNVGEQAYNKKKEILDVLKSVEKVNRIYKSGYKILDSCTFNSPEIDKINAEISTDMSKVRKLDDFQNDIHQSIMPMLRSMRDEVNNVENKLASMSQVEIDVTKWQVQETLTNIKTRLNLMTRDFPQISDTLGSLVQRLIDTLNTLINIYERIEQYQDRKVLVDYIAQINSPSIRNLNIEENLNYAISYLKIVLDTNAIIDPYKRTMNTLKQYVFPFAKFYISEFGLPSDLDINDFSNVQTNVIYQMQRVMKYLEKSEVSIIPYVDEHVHEGQFSIRNEFSEPFYTWRNSNYRLLVRKLLSGEKILLEANAREGLKINAVKFKTIGLEFVAVNPRFQEGLDKILNKFYVTMTHMGTSYYRCGEHYYTISTNRHTFSFSFQKKNGVNDPVQTNLLYRKLQQGDFILSPYALWEVQLEARSNVAFEDLKKYTDQVNIALSGYGQYVDTKTDACDIDLRKYYKIESNYKFV